MFTPWKQAALVSYCFRRAGSVCSPHPPPAVVSLSLLAAAGVRGADEAGRGTIPPETSAQQCKDATSTGSGTVFQNKIFQHWLMCYRMFCNASFAKSINIWTRQIYLAVFKFWLLLGFYTWQPSCLARMLTTLQSLKIHERWFQRLQSTLHCNVPQYCTLWLQIFFT